MSKPFEKPNRNEWLNDIQKYLKDDMTIDNLRVNYDGLILEPIYSADEEVMDHFVPARLKPVQNIMWISEVTSETNNQLLLSLEKGVEAIVLDHISYGDQEAVLEGVKIDFISLVVIQGNPTEYDLYYKQFADSPHVSLYRRLVEIEGGDNISGQIKEVIKNTQEAFIKYSPTVDFYKTIAELRAIKVLLDQFSFKYHIAAAIKTEKINDIGDYDLIEATYKIMSCYMGNCDFVSIENEDPEQLRLGYNIINVLNHESGFGTVGDPVSGSYFIEEYTSKIVSQY